MDRRCQGKIFGPRYTVNLFIEVWKNLGQAKKYGIRAIPTQIFFDIDGRGVHRHTGLMDKPRIVENIIILSVS